ncbi:MAG: hypothetical protein M0Z36_03975 [Thermaerobacter sp.]|nr:hypothetical protein [Thermaerobacter sp.]
MSMSQASRLFYGVFLNEDEEQAQVIAQQLIDRGVFTDDEAVDSAASVVHWFNDEALSAGAIVHGLNAELSAQYTAPLTTDNGITYAHLYLINGQPWDGDPLYFVGYPMDSKSLEFEEKLHPGIKATVDAELARFAEEVGLTLTPDVHRVTSWC